MVFNLQKSTQQRSKHSLNAFTLIELLVVISVIAVLAGILLPILSRAREQGRRAACMSNIRQFIIGVQSYASDYRERLPLGLSDNSEPEDEHTPILSRSMRNALVKIIGDAKALSCPWLKEPFDDPNGWYYEDYGYVLGYNYLGGHKGTPWPLIDGAPANALWVSPQRSFDNPNMPIITELNAWSKAEEQTFAPHGPRGAIIESGTIGNETFKGAPSATIGAAGGHVGHLDGSVNWKHINDMKIYRGSRLWEDTGCYTTW